MNNAKPANTASTNAAAAVAAPKEPSKKSKAVAIFAAALAERAAGGLTTNKDFRAKVLSTIQADLGVSVASAATMYNAAKKEAEAAGTVTLGRDPKKEKPASTGKRGRPSGSKNKPKVEGADSTNTVVVNTEAAPAADAGAGEALPA